jgi:hypothetical protein
MLNRSKTLSNSGNLDYDNQNVYNNIIRNVGIEENIIIKQAPNLLEQNDEMKNLNNFADKLNLGKNLIYNFSDFEYRSQLNKERIDAVVLEKIQTSPNNEKGIKII